MLRRFAQGIFCLLVLGAFLRDETCAREWADTTGKFRVEAELVTVRNGKVIFEKTNGAIISMPIAKLSAADQEFLRSQEAPTTKPAPPKPVADAAIPAGPLPEQVHAILKTSCYRCHGEDGASEGGFNYVLDLEKLARTHVEKNAPAGSQLFERLTADDDSVMPPPDEEPRPSATDIATVKAWIEAGAPAPAVAKPREFISNDKVMEYILADVRQANERSRRFLRYFTLTHLYNAGVSEDELQTYRNAFTKLLNSLSWNTNLVTEQAIDPARTIMRVDIRQLNWTAEIWAEVEQANPYFIRMETPDALACYEATQSEMPCVRVDWFVFAACKPPLYHNILGIPATVGELEQTLKVNAESNIEQEQVIRAGFNRSGVSQHNRLIEWHKSPYGSYWKSYDFGGSTGEKNLFEHPMGPGVDSESFVHDGGELIFTLPNGLQGYMLVDHAGNRIDKGPTEIVSDPKQRDRAVTNGVSCMSCHYTGVIPKKDEIRPFVAANPKAFEKPDDILALYVEPDRLEKTFEEDARRFAGAMQKLGITSLSRSGEPISTMAARFEQELDRNAVASEFGIKPEEFDKRLEASETMARTLGALRTSSGTVKRDVFVEVFGRAAVEFRLTTDGGGVEIPTAPKTASSTSIVRLNPKDDGKPGEVRRFGDLGWGVKSLAFSPSGAWLAAGKMDRALLVFDVAKGARCDFAAKLDILSALESCRFTPDGSKLLAGGSTGHILIWTVSKEGKLKPFGQFAGHSNDVTCIAVSGDSRFAVSGGQEKKLRYWQINEGKELGSFAGFEGAVKACHISSDGRTALATDGATLVQIDLRKNEVLKTSALTSSWASGQSAAISPDGKLVAAGDSYAIRLWEIQSGKELAKLQDNEIQWSAAFTPDGTRLITGGSGKVNVWDVRKQQKIHSLPTAGSSYVQCLATSPDNKHVAAIPGSAGQDLQVFRIPPAGK